MINFNGECFSDYSAIPEKWLSNLHSLPIHTHYLAAFRGVIPVLESHYFSMMSALRRSRVEIPMHFTLNYFQEQLDFLNEYEVDQSENQKIMIQFYRTQKPTLENPVCSLFFVMQIESTIWEQKYLDLILYKDYYIFADDYSNLFQTYDPLRKLARVFAYENGFGAALLLNHHKRVAGSTHGAVFLINDKEVQTSLLSEGSVADVLRASVIDYFEKDREWNLIETEIPTFSIQQAQEVFLISSEHGWIQINRYRKKKFETDQSKVIYQQFLSHLGS